MYFPGAKYQTFFRYNSNTQKNGRALRTVNATLFWTDDEIGYKVFQEKSHVCTPGWEQFADLRHVPKPSKLNKNLIIPHEANIYHRDRDEPEIAGVWSISAHTEQDLMDSCANHKTVFVNLDMTTEQFKRSYRNNFSKKLRWLHTAREIFPDRRFLVMGNIIFDVAYCFAMNGVMNKFDPENMIVRIMFPDGNTLGFKRVEIPDKHKLLGEKWDWLLEKYPFQDTKFYTYLMILMVPFHQKQFFEQDHGGHDPEEFEDHEFKMGYIFANTRLTPEKIYTADQVYTNKREENIDVREHRLINGLLTKRFIWNDALLCDSCTLNYCCKLYRPQGVCTMPGSEGESFSKKFASTNAQDILEGMGELLQKHAEIVELDLNRAKKSKKPIDKETRTAMKELFTSAAQLAKLRDPRLVKPQIQINAGNTINNPNGQREITQRQYAEAIREIEGAGVDRESIDEQMILDWIEGNRDVANHQPQLPAGVDGQESTQDGDIVEAETVPDERPAAVSPSDISDAHGFDNVQPSESYPVADAKTIEDIF